MAPTRAHSRRNPARTKQAGFTLPEVLAAIVILGMAGSFLVFGIALSLDMTNANRARTVGLEVAKSKLAELRLDPSAFDWPDFSGAGAGELQAISKSDGQTRFPVEPPVVTPIDEAALLREVNFYQGLTWEAHARLPEADAGYVEVTVAVKWEQNGRPGAVAVTSAMPRAAVEGTS